MNGIPSFSIRIAVAALKSAGHAVTDFATLHESEAMQKAITRGLMELTFIAQRERFTGQGPYPVPQQKLGNVSGRLKRDLHAEPAVRTATGFQGRIGATVEYFGLHEYGFSGTVSIREHTRQAPRRGAGSVRTQAKESRVKAHRRKMNIPERRPLRAALAEHSQRVITAAVRGVYQNSNQKGPA